mmetsp:Transcript_16741/g.19290  ORF Transcript_16741/g.19290 Transcript_16741/m.19290 type:complete len:151 (-) Transcript_16741:601-1053(-)
MGSFSTPYLIGYNLACCAGWAMILSMALPSVVSALFTFSLSELSAALASVYGIDGVSKTLTIVQSAAMLEIAHAVFGLVRSPVQVTSMQVGSRIIALFAINNSPSAQGKFLLKNIDPSFKFIFRSKFVIDHFLETTNIFSTFNESILSCM